MPLEVIPGYRVLQGIRDHGNVLGLMGCEPRWRLLYLCFSQVKSMKICVSHKSHGMRAKVRFVFSQVKSIKVKDGWS